MSRDAVIELFLENASKVAAEPVRAADLEGLKSEIGQIVQDCQSVFCPEITEKERIALSAVPQECREPDYRQATVCVDEVLGAIAETGSIVCSSDGGHPIQAGLLAFHHVAIVASENIYETLDDFFLQWTDSPPTNITLETGPSRTADIELTLTIGVHGPARLSIIVV
jgi:L-lactate dehydrogenase complex protein LldG